MHDCKQSAIDILVNTVVTIHTSDSHQLTTGPDTLSIRFVHSYNCTDKMKQQLKLPLGLAEFCTGLVEKSFTQVSSEVCGVKHSETITRTKLLAPIKCYFCYIIYYVAPSSTF